MEGNPTSSPEGAGLRRRLVFTYCVDGDLRFISHGDTLRLLRRAIARAALPVRFSAGFNPQALVRIPLPLPVGIASDAECVIVELERSIDQDDALGRLKAQTPADLLMTGVRHLGPDEAFRSALARYRLEPEGALPPDVGACVRRILDSEVLLLQRVTPVSNRRRKGNSNTPRDNVTKTIDIRPYLATLVVERDAVEFTLRVTPDGTARPAEIAGLLGLDAGAINHRIRRMEVQWQ